MLIWRSLSPGTLAAVLGHIAGQRKDEPSSMEDRAAELSVGAGPAAGPAEATILAFVSDRKAG